MLKMQLQPLQWVRLCKALNSFVCRLSCLGGFLLWWVGLVGELMYCWCGGMWSWLLLMRYNCARFLTLLKNYASKNIYLHAVFAGGFGCCCADYGCNGGVSENKARQAAEAVADINSRLARIETKISLIQWMISGIGVLLLVLRTFWGS